MRKFHAVLVLAVVCCPFVHGQAPAMFSNPLPARQSVPTASPNVPQQGAAAPAASQPAGQSASAAGAGGNPSMGIFESAGAERTMDKIFDVNRDSFDLNDGMVHWKGKTFSLGDSRIVRARFERYLSTPVDLQNFEHYSAILDEIQAQLTVQDLTLEKEDIYLRVRGAWSRLFDAAEYVYDGKSSLSIANIVAQTWRMQSDFNSFKHRESLDKAELDRRKTESLGKIMGASSENLRMVDDSTKKQEALVKEVAATRLVLTRKLDAENIAEAAAVVGASSVARQSTALNAIFEFQSSILTFFMERKFQQAQISSMFYKNMFRGYTQDLRVGKEKIMEIFGVTNYVPQISLFESMATEARKDIADGMRSVNYLYDSGQLYSALERLMETFVLGEYEPVMQTFPFEKKQRLLEVYKKTSTIKKLADAKDWGTLESIANDLGEIAADYPIAEIMSRVKAAQRASNMCVLSAKQAASLGQIEEVKKSLTKAAEIWPLNPSIETFNEDLVGMTEGVSKYVQKFDELYERGNFRDIVAEAPEYGMALRQDKVRAEKLREVVINISRVDSLIAQANEFEKQNNPYFAWDILENAKEVAPDDPVLARALAHLAPEVSDYVKTLNRAQKAEKSGDYAAALNYFLAAQNIFPASQACRLGIERVAGKYMQ